MKKLIVTTSLISSLCLGIFGNLLQAQTIKLKVGHGGHENQHFHKAWVEFKRIVEEESKGDIVVEIYPAEQMGGDRELIEFVQAGTLDLTAPTVSVMSGWDKSFSASELPYVFSSRQLALNVLNGDYGQFLFKRLEPLGMKGLGWFETGWRQMSNNKRPILSPLDVKGLKIRTMQVEAHILAWQTLGANPTPMAFGEVYSALQQGVIDGQENVLSDALASRVYEVNKFFSTTQHVYSTHIVLMNQDKFNSLSPTYQALMLDAVAKAEAHQQVVILEEEAGYFEFLRNNKVEVTELSDQQRAVFSDTLKPIRPKLEEQVGKEAMDALYQSIEKEAAKL